MDANKILLYIDMDEISESEFVIIHLHEIHRKRITRSSILQLKPEDGIVHGHQQCAKALANSVASFLEQPILLDQVAQLQLQG